MILIDQQKTRLWIAKSRRWVEPYPIKLGELGAVTSRKSALVHRFLTDTYMQEESTEGRRFKKNFVTS